MVMFNKKQVPILNRLPITRGKLFIARAMYVMLKIVLRNDHYSIQRGGIYYEVALSEGIDLSLFLFGSFQGYIVGNKYFSLPIDAVVFDVGANIGSMTLKYAQIAKRGRIYAFEPTDFAFNKLLRNISMNPELSKRIRPVQYFISDHSEMECHIKAYASWKVNGTTADKHPLHGGIIQPAVAVSAVTIDEFCEKEQIHRVDLMKIDTDGFELRVLRGARKTIKKCRPSVIFEAGLYIMKEHDIAFELFYDYFYSAGYTLINCKNGKIINMGNYCNQIPLRSTTDILALPS